MKWPSDSLQKDAKIKVGNVLSIELRVLRFKSSANFSLWVGSSPGEVIFSDFEHSLIFSSPLLTH